MPPALTIARDEAKFAPLFTDDLTIAAATDYTVLAADRNEVTVDPYFAAYLYLYLVGSNASATGDVTVYWQVSPDGTNWFDLKDASGNDETLVVTLDGDTPLLWALPLDLVGIHKVRVKSVNNADATYTADINLWLSLPAGGRIK